MHAISFDGLYNVLYLSYIGQRKAFDFVEYAPVLGEMSEKGKQRARRYREYVEFGVAEDDEGFKDVLKESPRSIGGDGFRAWIDELYQALIEHHHRPEDASSRRITEPLSADAVLLILAEAFKVPVESFNHRHRGSVLRGMAGRFLVRYAGMTQRASAAKLGGVGGDAVSRQMRKVRRLLENDRPLQRLVERVEYRLDKLRESMSKPPRTSVKKSFVKSYFGG